MSVQSSNNYISFAGNNSTVTPYAITDFFWYADTDLVVTVTDLAGVATVLTLNTDYTVSGSGDPNGGSIVTAVAVPVTSTVAVERVLPLIQEAEYNENDAFPAKLTERAFDKLVMICQQLSRNILNSLRVTASTLLNPFVFKANTVLGFGGSQPTTLTPDQLLTFLGASSMVITSSQPTAVFANAAARTAFAPGFTSQVGIQTDTQQIYISTGTSAGNWSLYVGATQSFADSTARGLAVPSFVGQLGVQLDTNATYNATATTAGSWTQTVAANAIADGSVTQPKLAVGAKNFLTGVNALTVVVASASSVRIAMAECVLTDGAGVFVRFQSPASITVDFANGLGVNGLDIGSEASNTWYNLYLISDGTNLRGVFSLSSVSPNATNLGAYTIFRRVAAYRNDGSSNLINTAYNGNRADCRGQAAITGSTYLTPTTVSLSSFIPPNTERLRGIVWSTVTNANLGFYLYCSTTSLASQAVPSFQVVSRSGSAIAAATWLPRTFSIPFEISMYPTSQAIGIVTSNHAYNLEITGWDIKLGNHVI